MNWPPTVWITLNDRPPTARLAGLDSEAAPLSWGCVPRSGRSLRRGAWRVTPTLSLAGNHVVDPEADLSDAIGVAVFDLEGMDPNSESAMKIVSNEIGVLLPIIHSVW